MSNETFGDYDILKAMDYLKLQTVLDWTVAWEAIAPTDFLKIGLQDLHKQVTLGANEWERRAYIELIFMEALRDHNLKMWQERKIDAGQSPLRGKVDFMVTQYQMAFKSPFLATVEAKKENFDQGWGQCLLTMKAAQLLNQKDGLSIDIYGIVSTGTIWEFGKYTLHNQFHKTSSYALTQPEAILGILDSIFTACEKGLEPHSTNN